jgi:hypothetical protein
MRGATVDARRCGATTRARTRGRWSTRARAFVPPIVPNPRRDDDDDDAREGADAAPTLPNIERALAPRGWAIGAERGYDDAPHAFKIFKARDGMRALEALQDALYASEERGCRIRRETQSLYYMCCDGVRCRLNEGKKEIVVEMPCDLRSVGAYVAKAKVIEDVVRNSQRKRASE